MAGWFIILLKWMLWGVCLIWLVVYLYTPLKNMSSSVGLIIPNIWKNNPNVPSHQSVILVYRDITIWYKPCMVDIIYIYIYMVYTVYWLVILEKPPYITVQIRSAAGSPVTSDGVCNGHGPENRGQTEKDAWCVSGQ